MSPDKHPEARIQKAHTLLEVASSCWREVNVPALALCTTNLEECVAELQALEAVAAAQPELVRSSVNALSKVKIRAASMERVADIMASFLRGANGTPDDSPMYRAGGVTLHEDRFVTGTGMQA